MLTSNISIPKYIPESKGIELADIMRDLLPDIGNLPLNEYKAVKAITHCRTSALGGHEYKCDKCDYHYGTYHSCRNRNCPKCGALAKYKWLEKRKQEMLNVQYFHAVFTIPKILSTLLLQNKVTAYNILFKSSAQTILETCENINNIGAKPGFISILHTWDQKLLLHPHIHMIIPGGGLSEDYSEWIPAAKDYFISTHKLSLVFRGKFIENCKKAYDKNQWEFKGKASAFCMKEKFEDLLTKSCKHKWGVFCKPTFKNTADVFDYLGRYTHRIAISNNRIIKYENGIVTFSYKDRNDNDKTKYEQLSAIQFVKRFLLHIVPCNFYKIRYYGFMANVVRKQRIEQCQEALNMDKSETQPQILTDFLSIMKNIREDFLCCPKCENGKLHQVDVIYSDFDVGLKRKFLNTA